DALDRVGEADQLGHRVQAGVDCDRFGRVVGQVEHRARVQQGSAALHRGDHRGEEGVLPGDPGTVAAVAQLVALTDVVERVLALDRGDPGLEVDVALGVVDRLRHADPDSVDVVDQVYEAVE